MANFRPVWAEIDLGALKRNYQRLQKFTDSEIMPVVKADAYGHGAVEVVGVLRKLGVKRFGVAFLEEALELRKHYRDISIMVIGPTLPEYSEILVQEEIIPEIFQVEQAEALSQAAIKLQKTARLHVKIDTGMGRIGFKDNALEDIQRIARLPGIFVEGIYTHLATADSKDLTYAFEQLRIFDDLYQKLKTKSINIPLRHAANSAAILQLPTSHYELCRPGIVLYGLLPMEHFGQEAGFEPVMSLKAKIAHLKTIYPGESVSYGRTFIAEQPTRVATLPIGYADGLRRSLSNRGDVLIKGQRAPIIGKICMDQTMVDVSKIEGVKVGDEVTLLGRDGSEVITADELAEHCDTISYEIFCGFSKRVPRIYKDS
ncbi:MAG TPA: alanine racemase [Peptococcaceae bacterium]|nr:alanine racemase [Peptococcaceae bacterium]